MPQSKPPSGGKGAGAPASLSSSVHALKAAMVDKGKGTKINTVA
jgi:hypothetical protein